MGVPNRYAACVADSKRQRTDTWYCAAWSAADALTQLGAEADRLNGIAGEGSYKIVNVIPFIGDTPTLEQMSRGCGVITYTPECKR